MIVRWRYVFDITIGGGLFLLTALREGLFFATGTRSFFGILSDCFVVPGGILLGIGLLSFTASEGFFDMLTYSAYSLIKPGEYEDFFEYKCRRSEKCIRYKGTVLIGLCFFAIGAIFLAIYYIN